MDFELSDAHRLIQQSARRVAREAVTPRAAEIDESGQYPENVFQAFKRADLLGITLPKAVGGAEARTLALALAVEEVAKYCCSSGLMLLLFSLCTHPSSSSAATNSSRTTSARWPAARSGRRSASPSPTPAPMSPTSRRAPYATEDEAAA